MSGVEIEFSVNTADEEDVDGDDNIESDTGGSATAGAAGIESGRRRIEGTNPILVSCEVLLNKGLEQCQCSFCKGLDRLGSDVSLSSSTTVG